MKHYTDGVCLIVTILAILGLSLGKRFIQKFNNLKSPEIQDERFDHVLTMIQ